MPRTPETQTTADAPVAEEMVVDHARRYGEARRLAEQLHHEKVLTAEEERLAECDAHAEANERLADGRERDDRTMGFTGTAAAPSGEDAPDPRTGRAYLHHQGLVVDRKRLEARLDRAEREMDEALGALLSAATGLAPATVEGGDDVAQEEGFDLLPGGGEDAQSRAVEPEEASSAEATSAA